MANPPDPTGPPGPSPQRPGQPTPEPHPCPRAAPPLKAEDCGDLGTYSQPWWQGSIFGYWWQAVLIVLALFVARFLLIRFAGPLLGP